MVRSNALAILFFVILVQQTMPSLQVQSGGRPFVCRIVDDGRVVATFRDSTEAPLCPVTGEQLQCDIAGAEPLDVPVNDACVAPVSVRWSDSSTELVNAGAVKVEWLRINRAGIRILATREYDPTVAGSVTSIPFQDSPDRFLRFSREGSSPVTMSVQQLSRNPRLTLPLSQSGGELVALVEQSAVAPVRYRLEGHGHGIEELMPIDRMIVKRGLPPGAYVLTPLYEGGIAGRRRSLVIRASQSTSFIVLEENVGRLLIGIPSDTCHQVDRVSVDRVSYDPSTGTGARVSATTLSVEGNCEIEAAGLAPGEYRVGLQQGDVRLNSSHGIVLTQQTTSLRFEEHEARVVGRVLLNSKPADDVHLAFFAVGKPHEDSSASTATNAAGYFAVTLPAGTYEVRPSRNGSVFLRQERRLEVRAGVTEVNFSIVHGTVVLNVSNWDRSAPLDLKVEQTDQSAAGAAGTQRRIMPGEPLPASFDGLGEGQYRVTARVAPPAPSLPAVMASSTFSLLAGEKADLTLTLKPAVGLLRVLDQHGSILPEASVSLLNGTELKPAIPGEFALEGLEPGWELIIRARGYATTCAVVRHQEWAVRLRPSISVIVEFRGRSDFSRAPGRVILAGAECPIPLHMLVTASSIAPRDGVKQFRVDFPSTDPFTFIARALDPPSEWIRASFSTDGVSRIELPGREPAVVVGRGWTHQIRLR